LNSIHHHTFGDGKPRDSHQTTDSTIRKKDLGQLIEYSMNLMDESRNTGGVINSGVNSSKISGHSSRGAFLKNNSKKSKKSVFS